MKFRRVALLTGKRGAGWATAMIDEIHRALEHHGIESLRVDLDHLGAFCASGAGREPDTIFVDQNHRTVFPWDRPMVSIMVDHPCSLIGELEAKNSTNAVTGWVDASHLEALQAFGFKHRAFFLPHAGPPPAEPKRASDKEIDVFFAGTLEEPVDRDQCRIAFPNVPPVIADVIFDAIATMQEADTPVVPALLAALSHHKLSPAEFTRDGLANLVTLVLRIAEGNRRVEIISALANQLSVAVASDYCPKQLKEHPGVRYLGYIDDFDAIFRLMQNSRIVLNSTMKFPRGSHERIWYAMAAGAVVLTDSSSFMKRDFEDGRNILYLPQTVLRGEDVSRVAEMAQDQAQLHRATESARSLYRDRHTWNSRVQLLIEALHAA